MSFDGFPTKPNGVFSPPPPGGPFGPANPIPLSYGGTGLTATPGPYAQLATNGAGVLAWRPRGDRVQLARLSNPAGGSCLWYAGQYIGTLSTDRVYSDQSIYYVSEYSAVGPETLLDWSISLYSPVWVAYQVAVWTITTGGIADTGIRIPVGAMDTFAQNLNPLSALTLAAGDRVAFASDTDVLSGWFSIFARRVSV